MSLEKYPVIFRGRRRGRKLRPSIASLLEKALVGLDEADAVGRRTFFGRRVAEDTAILHRAAFEAAAVAAVTEGAVANVL